MYLPNPKTQLPLFNLSIKQSLFDEVGLDNSISILSCCMTEKYVLFKSANPAKLVPAAETILGLLYPFQWQLAYVPNLPASHMEFLEMPQPYVIGVNLHQSSPGCVLPNEGIAIEESVNKALFCLVDLDSGLINWPEDQTPLPDKRKLITNIQNRLTVYYTENQQVTIPHFYIIVHFMHIETRYHGRSCIRIISQFECFSSNATSPKKFRLS